jgi:hypothetical protein
MDNTDTGLGRCPQSVRYHLRGSTSPLMRLFTQKNLQAQNARRLILEGLLEKKVVWIPFSFLR